MMKKHTTHRTTVAKEQHGGYHAVPVGAFFFRGQHGRKSRALYPRKDGHPCQDSVNTHYRPAKDDKSSTRCGSEAESPFFHTRRGGTGTIIALQRTAGPGKIPQLLPSGKNLSITYKPLRSLSNLNLGDKDIYLFHRNELLPESCIQCHDEKIKLSDNIGGEAQPFCFPAIKHLGKINTALPSM
jgi:hypothetical protein